MMWKALANGRAFLLLAAGLTVTGARRKRTGVLAGGKSSNAAARVAGDAGPQASGRVQMPDKAGAAWRQAGKTSLSSNRMVSR